MPARPPKTMTTVQVAAALGVSVRRVRQLKDRIGHTFHGRLLVFRLIDVRRYKRNPKKELA